MFRSALTSPLGDVFGFACEWDWGRARPTLLLKFPTRIKIRSSFLGFPAILRVRQLWSSENQNLTIEDALLRNPAFFVLLSVTVLVLLYANEEWRCDFGICWIVPESYGDKVCRSEREDVQQMLRHVKLRSHTNFSNYLGSSSLSKTVAVKKYLRYPSKLFCIQRHSIPSHSA